MNTRSKTNQSIKEEHDSHSINIQSLQSNKQQTTRPTIINKKIRKTYQKIQKNTKIQNKKNKEECQRYVLSFLKNLRCDKHNNFTIQSYCKYDKSFLCKKCCYGFTFTTNHSMHLDFVVSIEQLLKEVFFPSKTKKQSKIQQNSLINQYDITKNTLNRCVNDFVNSVREEIESTNLECKQQLKERKLILSQFLQKFQNNKYSTSSGKIIEDDLNQLLNFKGSKGNHYFNYTKNCIISPQIQFQIQQIIKNITPTCNSSCIYQSTEQDGPKYIHWFIWNTKKLMLYDLAQGIKEEINLELEYKVPSFSRFIFQLFIQKRSILLRSGEILLFGGEIPEFFPRNEVYLFDLKKWMNNKYELLQNQNRFQPRNQKIHYKLVLKSKIPIKKFDMTLAQLEDWVYVLSGKAAGGICSLCHRYNPLMNKWQEIEKLQYPRYAASAVGVDFGKQIFIFGGRNQQNLIVKEIEMWDLKTNIWCTIQLNSLTQGSIKLLTINQVLYEPMEVSGAILLTTNSILLFGGSDFEMKDSKLTLELDVQNLKIQKRNNMIKRQVFLFPPFLYGRYVYAAGNEYYMNQQSLQRYNVELQNWDLVF